MHIVVFGLNHNTAPVDVREKLSVSDESLPALLHKIHAGHVKEAVLLSTCNRTEVYFCAEDRDSAIHEIRDVLFDHSGIKRDRLDNYAYLFSDEEAYKHLFLVASGLDSMVVGEPQILGQVKDAYRLATVHSSTGYFLDKAFHKTFNVAKRIRTETKIGYNPVSISSMAVELSKKIFGDLNQKKILVIGAGEMCEIALRHFKKEGLSEIFIANRTYQKAQKLAEEIVGTPCPFQDIPELLTKVDMVLSSTGAEVAIINRQLVNQIMKKRKNRPLFFIDIAVPRDVDPEVNETENVYLYDIDDLKELSQKHLSDRLKESEKAHTIIEEETSIFTDMLKQADVSPLVTRLVRAVEETRVKEYKKIVQKLKNADEDTLRMMDILTRNIVNKLIHPHISIIKQNGDPVVVDIMKRIFKLEGDDEKELDSGDEGKQACLETNGSNDREVEGDIS
jgi:glutamyl-tRNA reductase